MAGHHTGSLTGRIRQAALLSATVLWALSCPDARAVTRTWNGSTSVDWFNAENWTGGQPTNGDVAQVVAAARAPLLVASTPQLGSLVVAGQTLTCSNWTTTIRATNVVIATNGTLSLPAAFQNLWMSNRVSIVCSNFTLNEGGKIDVAGKGYAISNGPGRGATGVFGGGGGHAGRGGFGFYGEAGGLAYDSMAEPAVPGSGAGKASGGTSGSGGGAVRIVATNVTINGQILANGTSGSGNYTGGGAGGSVHITCRRFGGELTGLCSARGGGGTSGGGGGSGGIIGVHYQELDVTSLVRFETSRGGSSPYSGWPPDPGAYGIVWFPNTNLFCRYTVVQSYSGTRVVIPGFSTWAPPGLTVTNGLVVFPPGMRLLVGGDAAVVGGGSMVLVSNAELQVTGTLSLNSGTLRMETNKLCSLRNLVLTNGASLYVLSGPTNHPATNYGSRVSVTRDFVLHNNCWVYPVSQPDNGGSVLFETKNLYVHGTNSGFNADAAGYARRQGPGKGGNGVLSSGAGYGGRGGTNSPAYPLKPAGQPYGSSNAPAMPGSGGGGQTLGQAGAGGGLIWIEATREIQLKGVMTANAETTPGNYAGGGSGGGIFIKCYRFAGTATAVMRAEGKVGTSGGGGGGGGRIGVQSQFITHNGRTSVTNGGVSYYSGTPSIPATPGTIVFTILPLPGTVAIIR